MPDVCATCGLPEDLCVCEDVAKEAQEVIVKVEERRYDKSVTIIEGIDKEAIDIEDLASKLKSKLACGGTVKNNKIELQGNHEYKAKEILQNEGFQLTSPPT